MLFLTELDSRAKIKGSRDPLGLQAVWTHFGRKVVGNLTTVSNSVRGFTTVLLGHHFAQGVREHDGAGAESTLNVFLKFEQLAAYCRFHVNRDPDFRGIERVKQRLNDRPRMAISPEPRHQILSNQKIYGLWGLYSVPAKASGLLEREEPTLTHVARDFVRDEYISELSRAGFKDGKAIIDLLGGPKAEIDFQGRHAALAKAIGSLLVPKLSAQEKDFYRHHLVYGGDRDTTDGRQGQLANLLAELPPERNLDMATLRQLIRRCRGRGAGWRRLAEILADVERIESLIAPAANAFEFVLARHGMVIRQVATDIKRQWGTGLGQLHVEELEDLESEMAFALHDPSWSARWLQIARAFSSADYEGALRLLVEQNAAVMEKRNGAPWVRVSGDRLEVKFREETGELAKASEVSRLWRHSYFIDSLRAVVTTLGGPND